MNNSKKISLKQFLFFSAAIIYILFCFVYNPNQYSAKFNSYERALDSLKNESKVVLLNETNLDTIAFLSSYINQIVAADTQVIKLINNSEGMFLFARIECQKDKRVLLKLSLDKQQHKNCMSFKYRKVLFSFELIDVEKIPTTTELFDFDNVLLWKETDFDILLHGKLDEILFERSIDG